LFIGGLLTLGTTTVISRQGKKVYGEIKKVHKISRKCGCRKNVWDFEKHIVWDVRVGRGGNVGT
jgi:hypothetical protein